MSDNLFHIEIFDTSFEGYGVGKMPDGKIIFIPDTVTGDIVEAIPFIEKKNFSYGKLLSVIKPSIHRIKPACPYAKECGGCQFMHINYDYQLKIKSDILKRELNKFKYTNSINISFSNPFEYRLRVKFKIKSGKPGYFKAFSNDFIGVDNCRILKKSLFDTAFKIANQINTDKIIDLNIIENQAGEISVYSKYKNLQKSKPITIDTEYGKIPATAKGFFQSNLFLLNEFQKSIVKYLNETDKVLELFCGTGFFSCAINTVADIVAAVDYDKNSIFLAKKYHKNINFIAAKVENFIIRNIDFNTLTVDPPRTGLSKYIIKFILNKLPYKIIYISCNPMTLSRDLKKLYDHYEIKNVEIFDMFPQTFHIESVVYLERK